MVNTTLIVLVMCKHSVHSVYKHMSGKRGGETGFTTVVDGMEELKWSGPGGQFD